MAYTWSLLKITRNTNLWRKGQRVWMQFPTGALAGKVVGRLRNKGRWIHGWVHWADENGRGFFCKPDARYIGKVEISESFHDQLNRLCYRS